MHVSNISKLIGFKGHGFDVPLKSLIRTIENHVLEDGLVLNPDFQRGHVWTEKQQIAFVEFILRGGVTNPILLNHPGWLTNFEGEFVCVDGLQRLIALLRFLENNLRVFDGYYMSDIEGINTLLSRIYIKLQINTLSSKKDVLRWYLELNSAGTPHTEEELDRVKNMYYNL